MCSIGGKIFLKFRLTVVIVIILFLSSILGYSDTTVPMKLNASAILAFSDGVINTDSGGTSVEIGLYSSDTEFVWRKTYNLVITTAVDAEISGTGIDSSGNAVVSNENLFDSENLQVGFTVYENGSPYWHL